MEQHDLPTLGLIWPDDGFTEPDYELLRGPETVAELGVTALRLEVAFSAARPRHEPDDLRETGTPANLEPAARELAAAGSEAVIWACTSGSFIDGLDWAREQARALQAAAGVSASSTTLAFIDAVHWLGADEVDLLGPYPADVTEAFRHCLEQAGLTVREQVALGTVDAPSSYELGLEDEVLDFARRRPGTCPLLLPDTAINSLEQVQRLERDTDRPVLTANQVTLWQGLRLLEIEPRGQGPGRLFAG